MNFLSVVQLKDDLITEVEIFGLGKGIPVSFMNASINRPNIQNSNTRQN